MEEGRKRSRIRTTAICYAMLYVQIDVLTAVSSMVCNNLNWYCTAGEEAVVQKKII